MSKKVLESNKMSWSGGVQVYYSLILIYSAPPMTGFWAAGKGGPAFDVLPAVDNRGALVAPPPADTTAAVW